MPHDDLEVPKPSPLIPFTGLWLMIAGISMLATGLQTMDLQFAWWWLRPLPVLMLAMGLGTAAAGGMVVRARFWAVLLGIGMAGLQGFTCLLWVIFAAFHGFISALPVITGFASLAALVFTPLAIGPARRLSKARAALLEDIEG